MNFLYICQALKQLQSSKPSSIQDTFHVVQCQHLSWSVQDPMFSVTLLWPLALQKNSRQTDLFGASNQTSQKDIWATRKGSQQVNRILIGRNLWVQSRTGQWDKTFAASHERRDIIYLSIESNLCTDGINFYVFFFYRLKAFHPSFGRECSGQWVQ